MNTGRKDRAYPRTEIQEITQPCFVFPMCGGKGGFRCPDVLGKNFTVFEYKVPKHTVYNRKLILKNEWGTGIDPYTDAGPLDTCLNSYGIQKDWWLGFGVDDTLTEEEIIAQGNRFTDNAGDEIEIPGSKLPQPTDAGWNNRIFIYIAWGNSAYVNVIADPVLDVVKYDNDMKL